MCESFDPSIFLLIMYLLISIKLGSSLVWLKNSFYFLPANRGYILLIAVEQLANFSYLIRYRYAVFCVSTAVCVLSADFFSTRIFFFFCFRLFFRSHLLTLSSYFRLLNILLLLQEIARREQFTLVSAIFRVYPRTFSRRSVARLRRAN